LPDNTEFQRSDETAQAPQDSLSVRAQWYRDETERVVRDIGEHPQYELKRAINLSSLHQRIDFIKDIQSIATSQIDAEKFLAVGADEARAIRRSDGSHTA
jgi:hypothetical protein